MRRREILSTLATTGLGAACWGAPSLVWSNTAPLTLLHEFPGANCHPTGTLILDADTPTPLVKLAIRNPEGGLAQWQSFRFGLAGCAGKVIQVEVPLAGKEGGPTYRPIWSGPFVANRFDDFRAWQPASRSISAGLLRFTVAGKLDNTLYVASMPPNSLPQCMSWIRSLVASHPDWIHDDLPSRVAAGGGPYTCATAPTVKDETGRTISGQPMLGFRIGNDRVGKALAKRRFVVMAGVHPSEDHGPIQLRGFAAEWLTNPALQVLRDTTDLIVYPIVAANGMHAGYRRYEPSADIPTGTDLNRSFDGPTTNLTAKGWRQIFAQDLHADLTRGGLDFHDVSPGQELVWAYHPKETPAGTLAAIRAEHRRVTFFPTTNVGTTMQWVRSNTAAGLHGTAITAEVSDEAGTLADYVDVGARWAWVAKHWMEGGLMGEEGTKKT